MFNGNSDNMAPAFDFPQNYPFTIYGKYLKDAKTAYRAVAQVGYTSLTDKEFVTKDAEPPDVDPDVTVEDKAKRNNTSIVLGFGIEKRRGKGRVQGIYGVEALLKFGSANQKYFYGNTWNPDFSHHYTDFGSNVINLGGGGVGLVTENKMGGTFGFGGRLFVGVEYFFAPKLSIGGEFGWGIGFSHVGEGEMTYEYLDYSSTTGNPYLDTKTIKTGGNSSFSMSADNFDGAINILFYF